MFAIVNAQFKIIVYNHATHQMFLNEASFDLGITFWNHYMYFLTRITN